MNILKCYFIAFVLMSVVLRGQVIDLNTLVSGSAPSGSSLYWYSFVTPSSTTLLPSSTVTATSIPTNYWAYFFDSNSNCYSPGSKVTVVSNHCPSTSSTVDLTSIPHSSAPLGTSLVWFTTKTRDVGTQVNNPTSVGNGIYWPFFHDSVAGCYSPIGTAVIVITKACGGCYKPGILDAGNTYPTKHGITAIGRAGENNSNWPMVRESAWTILEAKTKGFVINRIKTTAEVNALPQPIEGMTVYDVEADCLKIYTSKDNGLTFGWYCFTAPACPD